MKKRLIIIGAGGLAREIFGYLYQNPQPEWEPAGFLDDSPTALERYQLPVGILGPIHGYQPRPDDLFLPGIGDPKIKLKVCHAFREHGAHFATVIHPRAVVGYQAKIGVGVFMFPGASIGPYASVGDFVSMGLYSTVTHDCKVGEGCTLCGHCELNGAVEIGRGIFVGSHATILPKVHVGDFAIVGAGSACVNNIKARTTVLGVPAKMLVRHVE